MTTNLLKFIVLGFFCASVCISCKKDDDPGTDNPPAEEINKYLLSSSYGDLITYTVDQVNHTYSYINETTGQSGSGTFVLSANPNLNGVYEVSVGGDVYYAIELGDRFYLTSQPSGRPENKICFGVSSDLNLNNYSASDLAGRYIYIVYNHFQDSTDWGGFQLNTDGTFTYNFGTNYVTQWNDAVQFSGAGSGTWHVSGTDASRVIITEGGIDYPGSIMPGKVIFYDNGTGNGFVLGVKYPDTHVTQGDASGVYRFLDITTDGQTGVGYYSVPPATGTMQYYYKYDGGAGEGSGTAANFTSVTEVKNMFMISENIEGTDYDTYFMMLPGEIMLHFCSSPDSVISFGIGAKIN